MEFQKQVVWELTSRGNTSTIHQGLVKCPTCFSASVHPSAPMPRQISAINHSTFPTVPEHGRKSSPITPSIPISQVVLIWVVYKAKTLSQHWMNLKGPLKVQESWKGKASYLKMTLQISIVSCQLQRQEPLTQQHANTALPKVLHHTETWTPNQDKVLPFLFLHWHADGDDCAKLNLSNSSEL